jgi:glucosamine--fructose-6-phosphate aminotransferase (isomerizing)
MCGIIGYSGQRRAADVIIDGLKRLEYRGYDSAGVAVNSDAIFIHKDQGEISNLESSLPRMEGTVGIGHTRWATCGRPSQRNAHPFADCSGRIALVHNGIIENYSRLRRQLESEGHLFTSDTDTEVLVHLLENHFNGDLHDALRATMDDVMGTYAIAAMVEGSEEIVAARKENPLVIGLGVGENFIASDVTALLDYTSRVIYLLDGDTAKVTSEGVEVFDSENNPVDREVHIIDWTVDDAQKGGFEHFMLKEIYEQPTAVHNTLIGAGESVENGSLLMEVNFDTVRIIACGTSYHAGMIGKYLIEEMAKIPVTVDLASEYRYSSCVSQNPLTVVISQSGETADTLAALREAQQRGCPTLAITNVVGSTITREADEVFYTRAGPEIGVAATKTFTTQVVAMMLLGMRIGMKNRNLTPSNLRARMREVRSLPVYIRAILDKADDIEDAANMLVDARDVFFIGRHINYPTVLEGALKLKEISYLHAEGYAAGELKHGPLALIDSGTPMIAACVKDHTYDKMMHNISEVIARDGPVIAVGFEGDDELEAIADRMISIPEVSAYLTPILISVTLQLLAYHTARKKGCPIDKPRNLAKSVTVE